MWNKNNVPMKKLSFNKSKPKEKVILPDIKNIHKKLEPLQNSIPTLARDT